MAWVWLLIAGLLEVAWAAGLKSSDGFTKLGPSVFTIVTALASFGLLAVAMRQLPLGTAYAVWTGIGAVGAFVFGIVMMGEALTAARVASAALIVAGWSASSCRRPPDAGVRASIPRHRHPAARVPGMSRCGIAPVTRIACL